MMKSSKYKYWDSLMYIIFLFLFSCDVQDDWLLEVPTFTNNSALINSIPLTQSSKYALEGIYKVVYGSNVFGDTIVLKQTRDKISLFGLKNGSYFILNGGSKNSEIILEGYWRYALNDNTGLVQFNVDNAADLILGDTTLTDITITGVFGNGESDPVNPIELRLIEKFSPLLRADKFAIGAHRGGGRTSDKLPVSENSLAMINFTEYIGSTGIEIDVQLTSDKIPVLYHDEDLNIRLIQKGPLYGRIEDYKLSQLRTMVKLIHGENIPTLVEAFDTILYNTNLRLVWLDIKNAESLKTVIPLQKKYLDLAKKTGRDLNILIGIPTEEIYNAFLSLKDYADIPSLCELEPEKVTSCNAKAWAFRWTLGLQEQEVINMHAQGRKCIVWTLDTPKFTEIYTTHGGSDPAKRLNGILTNYPSILAYYHYVRHNF